MTLKWKRKDGERRENYFCRVKQEEEVQRIRKLMLIVKKDLSNSV